jgi:hypothetical protein
MMFVNLFLAIVTIFYQENQLKIKSLLSLMLPDYALHS